MRRTLKLAAAVSLFACSLGLAVASNDARAATFCQNICCDPSCLSYHLCHGNPSTGCICTPYCVIGGE